MNGLEQNKLHSGYDATSNNSKDGNAYGIDDVNILIQQIEGRNLSHDQMEKLRLLFSSLKKISAHSPQINNQELNLSPKENDYHNQEKELNNIKQIVDYLRKNISNTTNQDSSPIKKGDLKDELQKHGTDYINEQEILNSQEESKPDKDALNKINQLGVLHNDIANLNKIISEIYRMISLLGVQGASSQLNEILSKMNTIAKECSFKNLENNWQVVEKQFKELDFKNIHQQINSFSSKLDALKCDLDKKTIVSYGRNPEEKILSILNNTNSLLSLLQSLNERMSTKKVYSIDVKLSEIKAAIAKNECAIKSCKHNFSNIFEERLKNIEKQIQIYQKEYTEKSLQSLKILDKRLQKLVEEPYIAKAGELLTEISNKVSSIAQITDNHGFSQRLDAILQNMDKITKHNQFDLKKSFQLLEDGFKKISLQLENKQKNPEKYTLLHNLKTQIDGIRDLMIDQIDRNNLSPTDKKTAELMCNSIDKPQNMEQIFTNKFHECFDELQKVQSEHMIKNFTALYEMLAKISKKLDKSFEKSEVKSINHNNSIPTVSNTSVSFQDNSQEGILVSVEDKKELDISINTDVKYDQLDSSTDNNDELIQNIKLQEIEEGIPRNIQQILDRVSAIQNSVREDYNTIPDYISAARRAASPSFMGNDSSHKSSIKQGSCFIKDYSSKKWFETSIVIAIILIASSFVISPYISGKKFFEKLEFRFGNFI